MLCFVIFTVGEVDAAAADRTADMGISHTQVAMFVLRQRSIRVMPLFSQRVRNVMRQSAQMGEQQGENQQESGEQETSHGAHFIRET